MYPQGVSGELYNTHKIGLPTPVARRCYTTYNGLKLVWYVCIMHSCIFTNVSLWSFDVRASWLIILHMVLVRLPGFARVSPPLPNPTPHTNHRGQPQPKTQKKSQFFLKQKCKCFKNNHCFGVTIQTILYSGCAKSPARCLSGHTSGMPGGTEMA
jgi:hypothetical protein